MRVAIVLHQFLPRYTTGTELYVHALAREFQGRGVDVAIFTGEDDGRSLLRESVYEHEGLAVHRCSHHLSLEPDPVRTAYASVLAESAFDRFLERFQPDVVHFFHLYGLGGGLADAAFARGIPYLVHLMDYWFLCPRIQMLDRDGQLCDGPKDAWRCAWCASEVDGNLAHLHQGLASAENLDNLVRQAEAGDPDAARRRTELTHLDQRWPFLRVRLERAARVISPSRYLRDRFVANGLDPDGVFVLPYGVDPDCGNERRLPARPGHVRFGYVGNLATFKGAHLALEAFTRLEGDDLRLAVYGDFFFREREHMAACRDRVRNDPRIEMRGPFPHEEISRILRQVDAVLVPSLWHENTPFVVLEALCAGTPVIGSRVGGIEEVVRDGVDGYLFQRGSVEDLERQMVRFASGELPTGPDRDRISTLASNADALLTLYKRATREGGRAEPAVSRAMVQDRERRLLCVVEGLTDRLTTWGKRSGVGRDVVRAIRESDRLREELEHHRNALAEQIARSRRLEKDLERMDSCFRSECAGQKNRIEDLEQDLDGHRATVAALEADLEGHRRILAVRESDCQRGQEEIGRLQAENEALRQGESLLRSDLDGHRQALRIREAEVAGLKAGIEALEQDLDGHRLALSHAETTSRRLQEEVRRLEREVGNAQDQAGCQLNDMKQDMERMRALLAAVQQSLKEREQAVEAHRTQLAVLYEELDSVAQGRNL